MARSGLLISTELSDAFHSAGEGFTLRFIEVYSLNLTFA